MGERWRSPRGRWCLLTFPARPSSRSSEAGVSDYREGRPGLIVPKVVVPAAAVSAVHQHSMAVLLGPLIALGRLSGIVVPWRDAGLRRQHLPAYASAGRAIASSPRWRPPPHARDRRPAGLESGIPREVVFGRSRAACGKRHPAARAFTEFPGHVRRVREVAHRQHVMRDVFFADTSQGGVTTLMFAREGRFVIDRTNKVVQLPLTRGNEHILRRPGSPTSSRPTSPEQRIRPSTRRRCSSSRFGGNIRRCRFQTCARSSRTPADQRRRRETARRSADHAAEQLRDSGRLLPSRWSPWLSASATARTACSPASPSASSSSLITCCAAAARGGRRRKTQRERGAMDLRHGHRRRRHRADDLAGEVDRSPAARRVTMKLTRRNNRAM